MNSSSCPAPICASSDFAMAPPGTFGTVWLSSVSWPWASCPAAKANEAIVRMARLGALIFNHPISLQDTEGCRF